MRTTAIALWVLIVAILQSCTLQPMQGVSGADRQAVEIKITTRALTLSGLQIHTVRLVAYHKGEDRIELNTTQLTDQSSVAGEGVFVAQLPPGDYTFYAIVNEPANLTSTLDGVHSQERLDTLTIQPSDPFTETTVMLVSKQDAVVATDPSGATTVTTPDGTGPQLTMVLERAYTKVSLQVSKQTLNPADRLTIHRVDFVQSPAYSYLTAKPYNGTAFVSRTLFSGSAQWSTNGDPTLELVKASPSGTANEPSNIFAEYLLADADRSNNDKAAYLGLSATYTPAGGTPQDVYYKIPVGDYLGDAAVDGSGHDYNLKRNHHYALHVRITKPGEKDALEVSYTVEPWGEQGVNVRIEGDPFLDVSAVNAEVYDAAATRIYFYSNRPPTEVLLDPTLLNGTQFVATNTLFERLAGGGARNFTYTYDPVTERGEGYFDLINLHTDNSVEQKRLLYLRAGKLVREIAVTTRVSTWAAQKNTQPYIGTFHRAAERGERIVSWHLPSTTGWRVEVVTDPSLDELAANGQVYTDAAQLLIDRLASPNYGQLYTLDPPSAEGAYVTLDHTATRIEGQGRIYFRVGWATTIGPNQHRFAKIKVTTSTDGFATHSVRYLYCRQGEEPKAIVSTTTLFSCYNTSTPEHFVDYPTKTGYLYQWNRTQPWAVTGAINNYPQGDVANPAANNGYSYEPYNPQSYICPPKYSYPDNKALDVMQNALNPALVMYQWGYYADGFFDRRAISDHLARNVSGEVASAGGLFFSRTTAVSIFLPTASWRDYQGVIDRLSPHQQVGVVGHYWAMAQDGEWPGGATVGWATLGASALHLTPQGLPNSYLEVLNKASAASVRCMKIEGKTVYFDANGGTSTPRSITQESGSVVFPAGPAPKDPLYAFVKWSANRSGTGASYLAGATADVAVVGEKTWYAQYTRIGYIVNGSTLVVSPERAPAMVWAHAQSDCQSIGSGWRLPTRDEARKLQIESSTLFTAIYYWTSEASGSSHYIFQPTSPNNNLTFNDTTFASSVRCVKVLP